MKRPNALPPEQMTPAERRTELCALLALGLVRLRQRERGEPTEDSGDIGLHLTGERSRHATPTQEETA
jgi:hypothetical protein